MEVSVIASSQTNIAKSELPSKELGFCKYKDTFSHQKTKVFFGRNRSWRTDPIRLTLKAARSELVDSNTVLKNSSPGFKSVQKDGVRLFVGLPLDVVSDCNTINHGRAIVAGLKALKLLGVEGVELPIWWGIVEKEDMGNYDWSGYLAIAEMVQKLGMKLHVSLCFHGSKTPKISLPKWVSRIGEDDLSIYFTDRSRQPYKECLSLGVDDIPVLNGKTPIQVYQEFCESFKAAFSSFLGSTITGITMGLGPDGELRYPSHHQQLKSSKITGVGEFQCYDQNMFNLLKQCADKTNHSWGLDGPHDTPSYNQSPDTNNFFKEHGGSWESAYGNFFLSWYSSQLLSHGSRLLSIASTTFNDTQVAIYGKLPLLHEWYGKRSHPSELTAGFYNTITRNGYEQVAEMFANNSCKMIVPGMDLSDEDQPGGSFSSPKLLLAQILAACRSHGVDVSGENLSVSSNPGRFRSMNKNLIGENKVVDLFTYQRMGASFFSPEHFRSFTEFVRGLDQPDLHSDDLAGAQNSSEKSLNLNLQMV